MGGKFKLIVAVFFFTLVTVAFAYGQGSSRIRVGPETVLGGITEEEQSTRQAQFFELLSREVSEEIFDEALRVELTPLEQADLASPPAARSGSTPLRVGLVASVPPQVHSAGLQRGQIFRQNERVSGGIFTETSDGGFIWAAAVSSPGAKAIRLHLRNFSIPDAAELYFYSPTGEVRGPYKALGPNGDGEFWTNAVFSETAALALRFFGPYSGDDLRNVSFVLTDLGHIGKHFPNSDEQDHTWNHNQCGNASCVLDAKCGNLGPAGPAAAAVAKMEWIQGPFIYTCTGGLLADTDASTQRKLFLSANHCLSKSNNNLETFFNYTTTSCNGSCPGNPAPHTTGVTKLVSGSQGDFTLFELGAGTLPAGAVFLGWNNSPIAFTSGANLYRVSNPNFGPQVYSQHQVDTTAVTCTGWPRGQRIYSNDVVGATDGGSSGSPVVNSASEVVGQLSGCCGFNCADVCDAASNSTVDGALAHYWSSVEPFLDPAGGGGGCSSNAECDDGLFCNGAETCVSNSCQAGSNPCPGQGCNEASNQCVSCLPSGSSCTANSQCCSNKCKGPPGNKTCN